MNEPLSFAEAAKTSGSDKFHQHGYHRFYPRHLVRFQQQQGNLVEIGVDEGKSLTLWRNYLPLAFLHGVDINLEASGDRWCVHRCDQSDPQQVRALAERIGSAFAIVDDGSHIPEHQLLSFDVLFRDLLEPGGVYIFEDIEVSYWRRGLLYGYPTRYGIYDSRGLIEVMKLLIDWINREFLSGADRAALLARLQARGLRESTCSAVASIEFAHNCIILRRREPWEEAFDGREYLFADQV
jgi:hypothetical protein